MQAHFLRNNIVLALLVSACPTLAGPDGLELTRIDGNVRIVGPHGQFFESMPAEAQQTALRETEAQLESDDYSVSTSAKQILLSLNDNRAIQYFVRKIENGNDEGSGALALYGSEAALEYLIPDVLHGSLKAPTGQELRYVPSRLGATRAALSIISRSTQFPTETRAWAADRLGKSYLTVYGTLDQVSLQVAQWWEHNKAAILSQKYLGATWIPNEEINLDFLDHLYESPPPPPQPPSRLMSQSPPASLASAPGPAIPLASHATGLSRWTWIAVGILILGTGLFVWKRRT